MAARGVEAILLIAFFITSAASGLVTSHATTFTYSQTYNLVAPVPQFSSEAPELNFTIPFPVPRPSPVSGEVSVLVIAVEFTDTNHTLSIDQVTSQTIDLLDAYYSHVSYGVASVVGNAVGWIRLPHKLSYYGADNGPFVDDQNNDGYPDTWQLFRDAAATVEKQVTIANYQQIVILHAGYGQESSRRSDDIWSVTFLRRPVETPAGTYDRFAIVPEFEARGLETKGVYAHEFGHLLGLPDLYSKTLEEVGPWDLMGRGAWNGKPPGSSPAELLAWTRIFLGWTTSQRIITVTKQSIMNVTLDPIESPSSGYQVVKIPGSSTESKHYYLVEVRQKVTFDIGLPSSGVLITYIDETKSNPVKVIDAVQTSSTLDDAPFQVGQKYSDSNSNLMISVVGTDGSSFTVLVDTLAPTPDIAVESLTLDPATVHPNDTVSLVIRIANEGSLDAKSFLMGVYLNETLFASRKLSLSAGEQQEIRVSWKAETGGSYVFRVVLDQEKVLSAERNRENNVKTLTAVVGNTLTLELRPPDAGADLEWWLSVNGVNQTYTGIGEFQIGVLPGSNTLEIQRLIYLNPSSRYVFQRWSDGVVSNSRVLVVSSDVRLSVDFSLQYLLSLEPNGGATSTGGWYDFGTPVTISATSPSNVLEAQSQFVFLSWSGDVVSNSTTMAITMNRPYNVTANWKTQYYLHVDSPYVAAGEGWYDANTQATVSLSTPMIVNNATRYLFVQWSGDVSGVNQNEPIVMSGPKYVSAMWTTQYELKVESEYGHTSGAGWYAPNTQAIFLVDTLEIDAANGTRRVFKEWFGDAAGMNPQGTILMDAPKTIRTNWQTQYQVVLITQGLPNGTSLTIVVDGQAYPVQLPQTVTIWHDAGSQVSFSSNATVTEGFRRYLLTEWNNSTQGVVKSPQSVLKPETYTATYKALSMFPCIIATVTFGSEVTPEVQFLRGFRDQLVLSTRAGSAFINVFNTWYYSFSPRVANFIANHDTTRTPLRIALYPLIGILEFSSATYSALAFSPELAIVAAGVVASAMIGLIYLTPIDVLLVRLLAKKRNNSIQVLRVFSLCCLIALVTLALGEVTGSSGLLAFASAALVLTTLTMAPLLFSFVIARPVSHLISRLGEKPQRHFSRIHVHSRFRQATRNDHPVWLPCACSGRR